MNDKIYIYPYNEYLDTPNICYLKGDNKAILVDAGGGKKIYNNVISFLKSNNLSYPDYLLITHYHWDHMFAIGYYSSIAIGSAYTNEKIEEMLRLKPKCVDDFISDDMQPLFCKDHLELEYDNMNDLRLRPLDIITDSMALDLGNRIVDIYQVESPHTKGSMILYDHNSKTLILGDAAYGYIVGKYFYDNEAMSIKLKAFINKLDYKYVIIGHYDRLTKEEFLLNY